mmetsp:Transcript_29212/g.91473  ORF Transcript_29212/g.91473 Transcript_29212/m.91473 type:complete len:226 (+) Transcript_29212:310-987(+)
MTAAMTGALAAATSTLTKLRPPEVSTGGEGRGGAAGGGGGGGCAVIDGAEAAAIAWPLAARHAAAAAGFWPAAAAAAAIAASTSHNSARGTCSICSAVRSSPFGLTPNPAAAHSALGSAKPRSARSPRCIAACFSRSRSSRRSPTKPHAAPSGVRRASALSARSISRHSAREVNMRYGSVVPRVTRSSTSTPMYPWCRPTVSGGPRLHESAAFAPATRPRAAASS